MNIYPLEFSYLADDSFQSQIRSALLRVARAFLLDPFQVNAARLRLSLSLLLAARAAQDRLRVDVSLCDLIVPFLAFGGPHFLRAAIPADDRFIHVEARQTTVRVVVREFLLIGQHRARQGSRPGRRYQFPRALSPSITGFVLTDPFLIFCLSCNL